MKFTKEEARRKVLNCAKQYQQKLLNKKLLIIYRERKDNVIRYIEVVFLARNYQHLTGLEKIKQKMNILIDLRTEGDISISDFRERKQKLELELQECEEELRQQIQPEKKKSKNELDWDAIRKTLNETIDFSNSKIEDELVERFIAKIIPQGDNKFTWFVNLSGQTQESINMIVEGRKSNPTIYIDETDEDEDDSSSVHNKKRRKSTCEGACRGEKYSLTATPHRQQSLINKIY